MREVYTGNGINAFAQNLRRQINIYRRVPFWKRADCIYIHIPKAAGTSINHALYGRTLGHYGISEIRAKFPHFVDSTFSFSITRNPYDRLVSAYLFAKQARTSDMGIFQPTQYEIPPFATFKSFVQDWLVNQDINRLDHVFRSQSLYVCEAAQVAVDFLGQLETLDVAIAHVEREIGRRLVFERRNSVQRGAPYRDYYTGDLARTVFGIYKEDFERLEYSQRL